MRHKLYLADETRQNMTGLELNVYAGRGFIFTKYFTFSDEYFTYSDALQL
jgi:hypothetical protein